MVFGAGDIGSLGIENPLQELTDMISTDFQQEVEDEFALTVVNQGLSAVAAARRALAAGTPFQVAFIDMRMPPGINGVETAKALRQLDHRIYIVIITAYSDMDARAIHQELRHGLLYMQKPSAVESLQQTARMLSQLWQREHGVTEPLAAPAQNTPAPVAEPVSEPEPPAEVEFEVDDELMVLFREGSSERIQQLKQALNEMDWSVVRELAHTIKGSAASFGHPQISELAEIVQSAIDQQQLELAPQRTTALIDGMERAL